MNAFETLLELAIVEDIGDIGDVTAQSIFTNEMAEAFIMCRSGCRLAGLSYACRVFQRIDPSLIIEPSKLDGYDVLPGETVLVIKGKTGSMLKAERIALNFMAYLSGIATQTREHVQLAASLGNTVILDTRKTLPGYRLLAKEAVLLGGGHNHRMGLFDMVLIKDNHIDAAGGIPQAVNKVRATWKNAYKIEVECRTHDEVRQALGLNVDIVMLDNMDEVACAEAVRLRSAEFPESKTLFEASGDMNSEKLKRFAGLGLDYISVGRLTHSVTASNFSMQIRR